MSRAVPIHLTAMVVLIGSTAFLLHLIGPVLPAGIRYAVVSLASAYVAVWLAILTRRVGRGRGAGAGWRGDDRLIVWLGNGAIIAGFWMAMPYADEQTRLLAVMFMFGTVTVEVLGSIRRPPSAAGASLLPVVLPLSIALYFAVHRGPYSPAIVPFSIAYAGVVLSLARILQRSVDRTYAAHQAAEAALAEVAAERDAKTRFLASASHDLGQPLQAARLFFDQALTGPDPAGRAEAARKAGWALDTTEQLLRRILDHLRLESGAVTPRLENLGAGPLIARVAELYEPAARLAGVTVVAMPCRWRVVADPDLTAQALANLIANALRHSRARRLLIGARRRAGCVRLWVIDDGAGVPSADVPRLFDDYVQGSDHADAIRGGFGLGLASARRMAALMNGAVGFEPRWTAGAAFWLELPIADTVTL